MELIVRQGDREEKLHLERTEFGYRIALLDREDQGETTYEVDVARTGDAQHSLLIDGGQHEVTVRFRQEGVYRVATAAETTDVEVMDPLTHLARSTHEAAGEGGAQKVTAYMPGRVVEVLVSEGEAVVAGQGILVLEAMKMKNEIQAESAGVVEKILVEKNQAVEGGDPLFEIA